MTHKLQTVDNFVKSNFVHCIAFCFFYQEFESFRCLKFPIISERASLSLSNNSPFPLTSLAGETKYLKQVKIQGTLKHFWEGKKLFNCSSESI